jgi:hypothetical protein
MRKGAPSSRGFTAAWLVIAALLCAVIAVWGVQISTAVGPTVDGIVAVPTPSSAPALPHIVTDYTTDLTGRASWLCAELSPRSAIVQVETTTGELITTLHCPQK